MMCCQDAYAVHMSMILLVVCNSQLLWCVSVFPCRCVVRCCCLSAARQVVLMRRCDAVACGRE